MSDTNLNAFPASQVAEMVKLVADAYVDFYSITLYSGGVIYLKDGQEQVWNGNVWSGTALKMSGVGTYGDDQISRPKFQTLNPDAIFSPFVSDGLVDKALVTRFRVLHQDVIANNPYYVSQQWVVSRVALCTRTSLTLELRTLMDAPNFTIPLNTFSPPIFPSVTIS
jgi:hypothetical protein